ncbi:hypothetical protein AGMMS49975_07040 [Clostridia bacterium]|nr:hypothetical protein AGMMS49975_07040 [Clostridia bacterium]
MRRISFRTLAVALVICILATGVLMISGAASSGKSVRRYSLLHIEQQNMREAYKIDDWLVNQSHYISSLAESMRHLTGLPEDELSGILRDYVSDNEHYQRIYIGYTDGTLCSSDSMPPGYLTSWFAYERPWYVSAEENAGSAVVTEPYVDSNTGNICVSFSKAIGDDDGIIGVIAVDIYLDTFMNAMEIGKTYSSDFDMSKFKFVLTDAAGDVILCQRGISTSYTYPTNAELYYYRDIFASFDFFFFKQKTAYEIDKTPLYAVGSALPLKDWTLYTLIPKSVVEDPVIRHLVLVTASSVVLLLITALLVYAMQKLLRRSISDAENESKAKSLFLANMSHEIRTPMNAVIGLSELAMREYLSPTAYSYVAGIHQSGANLLAIINDILDLSKIEAGRLEITDTEYYFASVVNDVVNMTQTRIVEKSLTFLAYIDPNLPGKMTGDPVRIRQIIINLLSNAAKYTEKGTVSFSVTGDYSEKKDTVTLRIVIADSGMGIREEDKPKIFGDFARVNSDAISKIEGTGLGLSITKQLCEAMGGEIWFDSVYGEGTTFTALIPQKFDDATKIAEIKNAKNSVLFFEGGEALADSAMRSFEALGVPCVLVKDAEDLFGKLYSEVKYTHIFIPNDVIDGVPEEIEKLHFRITPVAMINYTKEMIKHGIESVSLPIHALSIANVLNGETSIELTGPKKTIKFIAPEARILIVDDIVTNLTVCTGLLRPFHMQIDCCVSGIEAVSLVQKNKYDLVLMDHMMPVMDGIEATKQIRAIGTADAKALTIIALTANAVSGMREMFIQNGMNDYIPKPIDSAKLYSLMDKWIPKSKQQKNAVAVSENKATDTENDAFREELDEILDVSEALAIVGNMESLRDVLRQFHKDLGGYIALISEYFETGNWADYSIKVHAVKSVFSTIGEKELSLSAYRLEKASKDGDYEFCAKEHPLFLWWMHEFYDKLSGTSVVSKEETPNQAPIGNSDAAKDILERLLAPCGEGRSEDAENILKEFSKYTFEDALQARIQKVIALVNDYEFEDATSECQSILETI